MDVKYEKPESKGMTFHMLPARRVFRVEGCDELLMKSADGTFAVPLTGDHVGKYKSSWGGAPICHVVDAHLVVTSVMPEGE